MVRLSMRAVFFIALVCTVSESKPACAQDPSAGLIGNLSPIEYFRTRARADTAYRARRYAVSESLYKQIERAYPVDGDVMLRLGASAEELGEYAQAVSAYEAALRLGVNYIRSELAYNIAQLEARLGHEESALAWIDSALVARLRNRSRMQTDSAFLAYRSNPRLRKQAGMLPAGAFTRTAGWRYDIAFYVGEAQRLHAGPTRPAYSPAFIAAAAALSRDVPHLSNAQILVGFQRLSARLGDGHSYMLLVGPTVPLQFYQFSDGLYVVKGSGAGASLVGSHVLRIGRVSADSAMHVISRFMHRDNEMTPLWLGVQLLANPAALYGLGLSGDSTHVTLQIDNAGSGSRTVTLSTESSSLYRKLLAPENATGTPPLWLQHATTLHWLTPLPELHAVYAQYNQVYNDPHESIAEYAEKVTQALRDTKATNLIVDVRLNNGGNRTLNAPLLGAMAAFRRESPDHAVYIITGRGTFSAAQVFIAQAEWLVNPVFVGEPSSSRPNFVGEETTVVLPYSGAQGSISNQTHQGSLGQDERLFIAPRIPVAMSSADYFSNHDPVMSVLTSLLARRHDAP